jgi:N,N-dimethylformamidase beta subunit-like protein
VQVSGIQTRRALLAALTAVAALSCAAPAGASPVAPTTAVLGAGDVAGLTLETTSAAPWTRLVSRHATAGARASASVLRSPGNPKLLIVSRALVARDSAHASAFKRALGRVGKTAVDGVDARALGVKASALGKAQRIVWRDGPVVGELVAVGAAKGDGLVGRLEDIVRTRVRRTSGQSAWDGLLARAGGTRPGPAIAQQAFALAVAPLPGVRVPRGPRGSIPDGTLATSWVLANYGRLAPSRRSAVDKIVRKAFALSVEGRAAGAQLNAVRDKAIAFVGQQTGVQLTLPVTIVRDYPSTGSGAATLGVDAGGSYRSAQPAARCIVSVRRGGASKTVIAAQVFHCLQIQLAGRADGLQTLDASRPWLGEGSSAYAGCLFAQDGAAAYRKAYATYVDDPMTPLDHRTYDAIGFFAHLSQSGVGALSNFATALKAQSVAAAYPEARTEGAAGLLDSWASSLYRTPSRGSDWDVSGPCTPARSQRPPATPIVLTGSGAITLTAPAYAAHPYELFVGRSQADAIRVRPISGHLRVGSSGLDDQPTGEAIYCLAGSPQGANPDLALSGGPDGAKVTVSAVGAAAACGPGGTATCRTQLCLPFSGNSLLPPGTAPPPIGSFPQDNPIPAENTKPGTPKSVWDVAGAGAGDIQGFTTDISYDHGQTASFKVDTGASPSAFHLDIYRMGWYQGMGAHKVATVSGSGVNQPTCANMPSQSDAYPGLVDCGTWSVNATWAIPADATSGVYFAKAIRNDNSDASHIFFIVRNDASHSALYYQTSDTTWQAYNSYGGNSLYTGGPLTAPNRAAAVSYNRPLITRDGPTSADWIFNAEYPMIRWLERNGYDVSYESGVDTDRYGSLLRNHRVFLSTGHDEYWSRGQRSNVESARGAGVNMAFFSGNEVFWKTRWANSIDGANTAYRTMVCFKETHAKQKIDPQPNTWTGTWRDPLSASYEGGVRPENELTGQIFTVDDDTYAIQVPSTYRDLPFWRHTSVASLGNGQTETLAQGSLGYEWDSDNLTGAIRPPTFTQPGGLTELSSTTEQTTVYIQDYGSTYGSGTATHHLTLYRAPSGALVFGAGTVQWSWGLDPDHDRSTGATSGNHTMQQATVNLFSDMSVEPATPQVDVTVG